MSNWKDDTALGLIAEELGEKVVEMYDSCGIPIPTTYLDPQGAPTPNVQQTVIRMFILDAEDFTSLDPHKLMDEYQRMQQAAIACGTEDNDTHGPLDYAHAKIAGWHGEAAKAFAEQVTRIEDFMKQQQDHLVYAMQAMGTAFGLAVQFRQSYYDMASTMIEACRAVIAKHPNEPSVSSTMLAVGTKMVQTGIGALGAKEPKDLLKVGIEKFKEAFEGLKERAPIDSSDAPRMLGSYLAARDQLRGSLEGGLNQLAVWLDAQRSTYFSLKVPILEPMPACTDVHSADFSYGKFFSDHHDPDNYSPKVEQERRKLPDQHQEGPIHRRLRGEE